MRTRIYNAKILTMEKGREIFEGEIEIEDGRITAVKEVPAAGAENSTAGIGNSAERTAGESTSALSRTYPEPFCVDI